MLAITLLVLIGTLISSYLYAEQVVDEFDSVPDLDLQNATRSAGITNMEWNKDDFKMVVRTHFASIGIFATFITRLLCMPSDLGVDDEYAYWKSGVRHFSEFYALWDSVRNANSLITLFAPELQRDFLNCLHQETLS